MTYQPRNPSRPALALAAAALSVAWLAGALLPAAADPAPAPAVASVAAPNDSAVLDADGHVRLASVRVTIY